MGYLSDRLLSFYCLSVFNNFYQGLYIVFIPLNKNNQAKENITVLNTQVE